LVGWLSALTDRKGFSTRSQECNAVLGWGMGGLLGLRLRVQHLNFKMMDFSKADQMKTFWMCFKVEKK